MYNAPSYRIVRKHVEWWADHVERRLLGNARHAKGFKVGRPKQPWNRRRFLSYLWATAPDYPFAVELANTFEEAIDAAKGNSTRFRDELTDRLREVVTHPSHRI